MRVAPVKHRLRANPGIKKEPEAHLATAGPRTAQGSGVKRFKKSATQTRVSCCHYSGKVLKCLLSASPCLW